MEHLLTTATMSTFLCGADAVGRRNPRIQLHPRNTTCRACRSHPDYPLTAWGDPKDGIDPDEFCLSCERDTREGHYENCLIRHPHTAKLADFTTL